MIMPQNFHGSQILSEHVDFLHLRRMIEKPEIDRETGTDHGHIDMPPPPTGRAEHPG